MEIVLVKIPVSIVVGRKSDASPLEKSLSVNESLVKGRLHQSITTKYIESENIKGILKINHPITFYFCTWLKNGRKIYCFTLNTNKQLMTSLLKN